MENDASALCRLISAIKFGDIVELRLNVDAALVVDEDKLAAAGSDGISALGLACKLGNVQAATELLRHPLIDPNMAKKTTTTVMLAAGRGHAGVVQALLAHPRTDVNLKRRDGVTALMLSVQEEHSEVTRMLLQHARTKPSVKALLPERVTPLVLAIRHRKAAQVALLLQCQRLNIEDNIWMRETPLEYARTVYEMMEQQLEQLEQQQHDPTDQHVERIEGHNIIKMLEAFEHGGCNAVAEMVAPCDRLYDCMSADGTDNTFSCELGLCSELLELELSKEARSKVEELVRAIGARKAAVMATGG
eukprot:TRINITY_DN30321_c0_g1_i1.p1 TRINITY_DN30321_c0_g1~~TRINITY_DN30321_c0_g1_i1.p1  ORF type:complete len:304 (-),score=60.88 TRINITY_DN30321_c0_g1_i1:95-1006(-)